jgi:hypothetical protein
VASAGRLLGRHGARKSNAIAVSAIALIVAGCGGGHDVVVTVTASPRPVPTTAVPASATIAPAKVAAKDAGGPLSEVGTVTESDHEGTTVKSDLKLGRILYGAANAPIDAMNACNSNFTTTLATSAYLRGQVTFSYTQGAVPTVISYDPGEVMRGIGDTPTGGLMALNIDGQWTCIFSDASDPSLLLQPGQSTSHDAWFIIEDARSNSQPALSQSELNEFAFQIKLAVQQMSNPAYAYTTVSGPDTAVCHNIGAPDIGDVLLPFAKLPFTNQTKDGTLSCRRTPS